MSDELHVIEVTRRLVDTTMMHTANTDYFPKRVRFSISNRLENYVCDALQAAVEANEYLPTTDNDEINKVFIQRRYLLQQQAITKLKSLTSFIDVAHSRKYIPTSIWFSWTEEVKTVSGKLKVWRDKDAIRYGLFNKIC